MNIETEITPNPETLKFIIKSEYIKQHGIEIKSNKEAKRFKFSNEIFQIKGVNRIFIGENFVSVTKDKNITWNTIKTKILTFLIDYISSNKNIIDNKNLKKIVKKGKDKISINIEKIIDEKVRPAVARDGGDIKFKKYNNGIVTVQLQGSCSGCPSSIMTLKQGVQNLLCHYIPEVKEVIAI